MDESEVSVSLALLARMTMVNVLRLLSRRRVLLGKLEQPLPSRITGDQIIGETTAESGPLLKLGGVHLRIWRNATQDLTFIRNHYRGNLLDRDFSPISPNVSNVAERRGIPDFASPSD